MTLKNTTGECFSELSSAMSSVMASDLNVKSQMNDLMSDFHWFGQKVTRVTKMAQTDGVDLFKIKYCW